MITRRFCLFLLGGAAMAQIGRPRIGYLVDRDGSLRAVEGVAGAFTIGPVLEGGVLSAAFSGKTLIVKKADSVRIDDQTLDAPEGAMAVVFDRNGRPAEIFFPAAHILWTWHEGGFTVAPAYDIVADVQIRRGELIVEGVPVRLACEARTVSQLGEGWLVVYSDEGTFAVQGSRVFELPEAADAE